MTALYYKSPSEGNETLADRMSLLMQDILNCRSQIEAALEFTSGCYTFDDVVAEVISGSMFFYPLDKSFLIATVNTTPQKNTFTVIFGGGDLGTLIAFEDTLIQHAKALDCSSICVVGRKGWERALTTHGYGGLCISMDKDI